MILIIDRNRWLRGEGANPSFLQRNRDGKRCCLGSFALAKGFTEDEIRSIEAPRPLVMKFDEKYRAEMMSRLSGLFKESKSSDPAHSSVCTDLMCHNDTDSLVDKEREEKIREDFEKIGVMVFFSNAPLATARIMQQDYAYYRWQNTGDNALDNWLKAEEYIQAP